MDPRLTRARNLDGSPRFHPAGEHPALHRLRWTLERAYALRSAGADSPDLHRFIIYLEEQLSAAERGEVAAKIHYLLRAGATA